MTDTPEKRAWLKSALGYTFNDETRADGSEAPTDSDGAGSQALSTWRQALASVEAEVARFSKSLLADPAIQADPRKSFVAAAAAEIPRMLPPGGRKLESTIAAAVGKPDANAGVLTAVAQYRKALAGAARLGKLEAYSEANLKTPLAVRATLTSAIDDIERALAAVA